MVDALIMAGGESKRMRQGGDARHKALVPVRGIPLIERNLRYVMGAGFLNVAVSVRLGEESLVSYVRTTAPRIAEEFGGTCSLVIENPPLGTIGAAREVPMGDALLVINVDNLTGLSLRAMLDRHCGKRADFTIAAHRHPLPLDFGELIIEDGAVVEYREKPVRYPLISSGVYMLSKIAVDSIEPQERLGVPELFARVRSRGLRCITFEHDGYWVDINDVRTLADAEAVLATMDMPSR